MKANSRRHKPSAKAGKARKVPGKREGNLPATPRIKQGSTRNITAHKQAKAELPASQELHRLILQTSFNGFWRTDLQGRLLEVNAAYCRMSGYTESELLSMNVADVEAKESSKEMLTHIQRVIARGSHYFESLHRRKDGSEFDVEISAQYQPANGGQIVAFLRDITERKRAEDALRESEERLRLFIEYAPNALAMFDNEMRYLAFSRRWREVYELGDRDIVGQCHYDLFPDLPERWRQAHRRGMAGEVVREEEDLYRRTDGTVQWARWEVRPWRKAGGSIGGILIFTEDITARKQAEEELKQKNIALSEVIKQIAIEKDRVKSEVLINVERFLIPTLKKLYLKGGSRKYIQLLENNLKDLVSSFGLRITDEQVGLTSKEIELCNMIKNGLSSKEIAELLNISHLTVSKHRRNIRIKLGISNKAVNLTSYLKTR